MRNLSWPSVGSGNESFVYDLTGGRSKPPARGSHGMTRYLISFNDGAMDHIPDEDMPAVAKAAHAVVQEALNAGVYLALRRSGGAEELQEARLRSRS